MLKSQGPGGSFIEPGAKRLNRLMVTAQVHPVGKQYYYLSEVQVKPIRDAGEAEVAAAPGGEKAAAAGITRAGNIEAKGACGPGRGSHKGSDHFRVKKVVSSFPGTGSIEMAGQSEDLGTGAEQAGMAGDAAGGPGVFIMDFALDGAAGDEADFGGGIRLGLLTPHPDPLPWRGEGRKKDIPGSEAEVCQAQRLIEMAAAEGMQILAGDGFDHGLEQHKAQVAVDGELAGGRFQGLDRGQPLQGAGALCRGQRQNGFVKRLPGRQARLMGQQVDQGQTFLVVREPGQELAQVSLQ